MNEWLEELGDHFIGLWKLSVYQDVPGFCVTVCVNEKHWDTKSYPTAARALFAATQIVRAELNPDK